MKVRISGAVRFYIYYISVSVAGAKMQKP